MDFNLLLKHVLSCRLLLWHAPSSNSALDSTRALQASGCVATGLPPIGLSSQNGTACDWPALRSPILYLNLPAARPPARLSLSIAAFQKDRPSRLRRAQCRSSARDNKHHRGTAR